MRFFGFGLVTLALAAAFVAAESELAHAMEMIFMYSKYQTEGMVYNSGYEYEIAPDCAKGLNRRCSFNEFVSYIKFGNRQPALAIIELNGKFNWNDDNKVRSVATKMATMLDPTDQGGRRLLMAGEIATFRVNPLSMSITGLFTKLQEFDSKVAIDIAKMPDGGPKTTAQALLDASNNKILKAAEDLREATRGQKLYEELTSKFSPTGKLDKIYEYQKDGKTLRFAPIQWTVRKVNLWGRYFQSIDLEDTIAKNPQMNDPILMQRVDDHTDLFNSDGTNRRGEGLIKYDRKYAGTNGRHRRIIDLEKMVRTAYGTDCGAK